MNAPKWMRRPLLSDDIELGTAEVIKDQFGARRRPTRTINQIADELDASRDHFRTALAICRDAAKAADTLLDELMDKLKAAKLDKTAELDELDRIEKHYGERHARAADHTEPAAHADDGPSETDARLPEPDAGAGEAPRPAPQVQVG